MNCEQCIEQCEQCEGMGDEGLARHEALTFEILSAVCISQRMRFDGRSEKRRNHIQGRFTSHPSNDSQQCVRTFILANIGSVDGIIGDVASLPTHKM